MWYGYMSIVPHGPGEANTVMQHGQMSNAPTVILFLHLWLANVHKCTKWQWGCKCMLINGLTTLLQLTIGRGGVGGSFPPTAPGGGRRQVPPKNPAPPPPPPKQSGISTGMEEVLVTVCKYASRTHQDSKYNTKGNWMDMVGVATTSPSSNEFL